MSAVGTTATMPATGSDTTARRYWANRSSSSSVLHSSTEKPASRAMSSTARVIDV